MHAHLGFACLQSPGIEQHAWWLPAPKASAVAPGPLGPTPQPAMQPVCVYWVHTMGGGQQATLVQGGLGCTVAQLGANARAMLQGELAWDCCRCQWGQPKHAASPCCGTACGWRHTCYGGAPSSMPCATPGALFGGQRRQHGMHLTLIGPSFGRESQKKLGKTTHNAAKQLQLKRKNAS